MICDKGDTRFKYQLVKLGAQTESRKSDIC